MNSIQFKKIFITGLSLTLLFISSQKSQILGVSSAEKAKEKIIEDRQYIYALEVSIKNFGTDEQKNEFNAIKDQYMIGLGYFMEDGFPNAYKELLEAQKKLDKLYEKVSMDYLERTSKILKELVKNMVEIDIKYNKNSDLVRRFGTDTEAPLLGKQDSKEEFYDKQETKDFHLIFDKKVISRNIDMGFNRLGDAKRVRQEAVTFEEKKYEDGQTVDPAIYRYRLDGYLSTIELCREAKKNAFQAYQLINRNDVYPIQTQFRGNRFAIEADLLPVFDPRIPDDYKIDASDAMNLVHADEIRVKLNHKKKAEPGAPAQPAAEEKK